MEWMKKLYSARKLNHGGDRNSSGQNAHLKTAEQIGKEYGVTGTTVRNDAEFSKSVDKITRKSNTQNGYLKTTAERIK